MRSTVGASRDGRSAPHPAGPRRSGRLAQNLTVRLAVALAFADASIVVLALPQIVARLHASISGVTWVIMSYNIALIATAVAILLRGGRLASTRMLLAGLALFGLASLGCGAANSMAALIPFRCAQGVGGALVLCASLPMFASTARAGDSPLIGWSAAAAIGVAVGPAAGGILTQFFDWRSIFLAQAPVAAIAAALVSAVHVPVGTDGATDPAGDAAGSAGARGARIGSLTANAGLTLLSAGLIAALFLIVLELIDVWRLRPIAAAAIVTAIPLCTAIAERAVRGSSTAALGAGGAVLVAAGLLGASLPTHRELGWVTVALALLGSGLGLAFPGLTTAALAGAEPASRRAAKTVAARDAGILLGLLILTPVFVSQLHNAPNRALPAAARAVLTAPLPLLLKLSLIPGLEADYHQAPQSELPDFGPTFARASAAASPSERDALGALHARLDAIVSRAAAGAFRLPLRYGALFALAVLPLLGLSFARVRRASTV